MQDGERGSGGENFDVSGGQHAGVVALGILFAIYAFIGAAPQAMRAFSSRTAGPVLGHLLLALIDLTAGVATLVWPAPTALVLVLIVAIWTFGAGFAEIFAAFSSSETAGNRTMFIVTGLSWIAFGAVLGASGIGAVTVAPLFGLFAMTDAVWEIVAVLQDAA